MISPAKKKPHIDTHKAPRTIPFYGETTHALLSCAEERFGEVFDNLPDNPDAEICKSCLKEAVKLAEARSKLVLSIHWQTASEEIRFETAVELEYQGTRIAKCLRKEMKHWNAIVDSFGVERFEEFLRSLPVPDYMRGDEDIYRSIRRDELGISVYHVEDVHAEFAQRLLVPRRRKRAQRNSSDTQSSAVQQPTNKSIMNLKAGSNRAWNHTPTKAVRIPEVFTEQILEIARSLDMGNSSNQGIDLESLPLKQLLEIQKNLLAIIARKKTENSDVHLDSDKRLILKGSELCIYHPYDADEISNIKSIQPSGSFEPKDKSWRFPVEAAEELIRLCDGRYQIDPAILSLIETWERQREIEAVERVEQANRAAKELIELIKLAKLDKPKELAKQLLEIL